MTMPDDEIKVPKRIGLKANVFGQLALATKEEADQVVAHYSLDTPERLVAREMLEALKKHYRCPGSCYGKGYYEMRQWNPDKGSDDVFKLDCPDCAEVRDIIAKATGETNG